MALGNTQKMVETKQIEFATAMKKKLQEEKGSKLIEFSQKATVKGANKYTFYILGESAVGTNELNMYDTAYAGNGGEAKKIDAEIDYVYASDKIKRADLNSTSLDISGSLLGSLTDALKRNVDKKILDVINAKGFDATATTADKCVLVGDTTKPIDDVETVNTIIETAAYLATLAKETSVEGTDVCIVVDASEYAKLHRAEKFTKNDWMFSTKMISDNTLFGCEVIKVAQSAKANKGILLIARGAFGTASWENDVNAESEWLWGQDCLGLKAFRSLGVAVLDEKAIYKVQYKTA